MAGSKWTSISWSRAQRGDEEAFAASPSLSVAASTVSPIGSSATSILPRMRRSRRCWTIWQDLPQLRDPARFEAWSYRDPGARLLHPGDAEVASGAPSLSLLPADEPQVEAGR